MADFMKILQQAQEMQGRFQKLQEELQQQTVKASSAGGMVTVEANGQGTVKSIKIDPSIVNASDVEMLEDLVLVAAGEHAGGDGQAYRRPPVQAPVLTGRRTCRRSTT
jgi:DNA-binding YbaB/EbfC family protein